VYASDRALIDDTGDTAAEQRVTSPTPGDDRNAGTLERSTAMTTPRQHATPTRAASATRELRYWMSAPPVTINLAAPLSDALALMREHDIRRLPVVIDTGELRGIITQGDIRGADLLRLGGVDAGEIADLLRRVNVYEVMTADPVAVTPRTTLREAALPMIEGKIGGLPVVDERHSVVGIVTGSDLFGALVHQPAGAL
jgi:acetoin utilization protein AcuB/CBS domain-containing protein